MTVSVRRIGLVAAREFMAAVANKGFVIGLLVMPAFLALMVAVFPRVLAQGSQPIRGEVAIVDHTGQLVGPLRSALAPDAIMARRLENTKRALDNAPAALRSAASPNVVRAIGTPLELTIIDRPATVDLAQEKQWLLAPPPSGGLRHLALIVVEPNAVVAAAGQAGYGSYELFVPENIDERVEAELYNALRETLVTARIRAHNLDRGQVEAVMRVRRAASVTVADGAERRTNVVFNRMLPFVFGFLLVFGVMIGGQTLLTQTVEEKSNRVIEVLLSAVSPVELMAGKILGQMAVSMLVLALYIAMGLLMLMSFAMFGLVDPMLIVYLVIFFVISYLLFAAVFSAVGAAVNEMREAQALMTPLMLALMGPWMFAPVIVREPNSLFAVALSFLPPVNSFAMLIRLTSTTPPPTWQVVLTIVVGLLAACAVTWFAAKIFKVGLLMHGKAPNMGTLMRWAREA